MLVLPLPAAAAHQLHAYVAVYGHPGHFSLWQTSFHHESQDPGFGASSCGQMHVSDQAHYMYRMRCCPLMSTRDRRAGRLGSILGHVCHALCKVTLCEVLSGLMLCFIMQIGLHQPTKADDAAQLQHAPHLMNMSNSSRILSSFGAALLSGASKGVLIMPCSEIAGTVFLMIKAYAIIL